MSRFTPMLLKAKGKYKNLYFELEKYENYSDYFSAYHIPKTEKLICYAVSNGLSSDVIEGKGTIITDRALYFDPLHKDWAPKNNIPLSDLCHYFIFQKDSRDTLHLISSTSDYSIFDRTVSPLDHAGEELASLLRGLQSDMMTNSKDDKLSFESTCAFILDTIRKSFSTYGVLNDKYFELLSVLSHEEFFKSEIFLVKAQNLYRKGDEGLYYSFLEDEKNNITEALYQSMLNPDKKFFDAYITDLSNPDVLTISEPFVETYLKFKEKRELSLNEAVILLYLCTYIGDEDYFSDIISLIDKDLDLDSVITLRLFRSRFFNDRMGKVYDKLLSDVELDGRDLTYTDALGLTPLHYALMTRDKSIVEKVLKKGNWYDSASPFNDKISSTVYDYFFLTTLLFDDRKLSMEVYYKTRRNGKPLFDTAKKLTNLISINKTLYRENEDSATKDRLDDLSSMYAEVCSEINHIIRRETLESVSKAKIIFETKHSFACFMLKFFMEPDSIYRNVMETLSSCRLYFYKGQYFITPSDENIDLSYVRFQDGEIVERNIIERDVSLHKETSSRKKEKYENPYFKKKADESSKNMGNSHESEAFSESKNNTRIFKYFSNEAQTDIHILKKEYHELVKKYHPDVNEGKDSEIVIKEIFEERERILSGFAQ